MEIVSYPAIFTPKDNEIQVDFPDLPEAFTQGKQWMRRWILLNWA